MSLPTPSKDPFEEPSFLSTFLPTIFHTTISPYHFFRFNFVPFFIHVRILSSVFFNFFKFLSLLLFFLFQSCFRFSYAKLLWRKEQKSFCIFVSRLTTKTYTNERKLLLRTIILSCPWI
jgi:hypothetical protein